MNRKAAEIGMKSTHFDNPHGLTAEGHQTTARDLAHLATLAFKQPEFRKVVGTPQHGSTVDSVTGYKRNIVWKNTNQLLKTEGYDGIKTGTTGAAGSCLVSTAERGRPAADHRRARFDVDRIALRRHAESVSLGVEGFGEDQGGGGRIAQASEERIDDECTVTKSPSIGMARRCGGRIGACGSTTRGAEDEPPVVVTDEARELHAVRW